MNRGLLIVGLVGAGAGLYYLDKQTGGGIAASISEAFDPVNAIAEAIAVAEGYYVSGSRSQRDNNPGDMTADIIGKAISMDGPFVVYATAEDGWENLRAQIRKWFDGSSAHADSSSTIADLSGFYTSTEQNSWASNVAKVLGVSTDTTLSQIGGF